MITYLIVSVVCVAINYIYGIFGHGVSSAAMTYMFLYPLLCGALPFALLWLLGVQTDRISHFRLCYNAYNSGLVLLTIGSMLRGVFEIAGTSSPYVVILTICGWSAIAVSAIGFLVNLLVSKKQAH